MKEGRLGLTKSNLSIRFSFICGTFITSFHCIIKFAIFLYAVDASLRRETIDFRAASRRVIEFYVDGEFYSEKLFGRERRFFDSIRYMLINARMTEFSFPNAGKAISYSDRHGSL